MIAEDFRRYTGCWHHASEPHSKHCVYDLYEIEIVQHLPVLPPEEVRHRHIPEQLQPSFVRHVYEYRRDPGAEEPRYVRSLVSPEFADCLKGTLKKSVLLCGQGRPGSPIPRSTRRRSGRSSTNSKGKSRASK